MNGCFKRLFNGLRRETAEEKMAKETARIHGNAQLALVWPLKTPYLNKSPDFAQVSVHVPSF